ncbi:MAG TPA: hypothetical protein VJ256_02125 [Dehalococcoidia bacterium]|nr:hypothetical protein [Dehalococcoidia bacterium]HLB29798.1 hypothetical protein [Dehalococcoidia bacterium]
MAGLTVLVVSASPLMRDLLFHSLGATGYTVLTREEWPEAAPGGAQEALVLVLDACPDQCSTIAVRGLRKAASKGPSAVVMLCDTLPAARRRRLAEGIIWLAKPFSLSDLLRAVDYLSGISSRRPRDSRRRDEPTASQPRSHRLKAWSLSL